MEKKKAKSSDFIVESKMGCKTVKIVSKINQAFVQRLSMNIEVNMGSKHFITKIRVLKKKVMDAFLWLMTTNSGTLLKQNNSWSCTTTRMLSIQKLFDKLENQKKFDKWVNYLFLDWEKKIPYDSNYIIQSGWSKMKH